MTSARPWAEMDDWLIPQIIPAGEAPDFVLAANAAAGLPAIDVAPAQGKLLYLLARMMGARRILEIGTLGGYSTIWLARAVAPGGRVVTLEFAPEHAAVAGANIARAGFAGIVDVKVGAARETLPTLSADEPFDLIFIDADKVNYPFYLPEALRLSRPGTVIIADNVVRDGAVMDAATTDANARGIRAYFAILASEPRLSSTAIQTVGRKGWDGMAISIVA